MVNGRPGRFTGNYIIENSVNKLDESAADLNFAKAEVVSSLELGYRYNTSDLTIDVSAYYNGYQDKIAGIYVYTPIIDATFPTVEAALVGDNYWEFQVDSNLDNDYSTYGVSLEVNKNLSSNLDANLVYEYNNLDFTPDPIVEANVSWNTPEHRIKAGLNYRLGDIINIIANARYNSEYFYQSSFFNTDIPENTVLDAKMSLNLKNFNSILEIGGNNIGGDNYIGIPGAGLIGSVYYAALKMSL